MSQNVERKIILPNSGDCFTVITTVKKEINFPVHYHKEYELNLILNGKDAIRTIGDNSEVIGDIDLVLIGPDLNHSWYTHNCESKAITIITIQFPHDTFETLLKRNQLSLIKIMFDNAKQGILFSHKHIHAIIKKIILLSEKSGGFDSTIELLSILHDLSVSKNKRILSNAALSNKKHSYKSNQVVKTFQYIENNYDQQLTLAQVAKAVNMSETAFRRFIKKWTGQTFSAILNEIRLGKATKMLIDTTYNIAEIGYKCGFENISNFNRIFKRKKMCIPKKFRNIHSSNQLY